MIVTLPTASELLAGITAYSAPLFADLWPMVPFALGFFATSAILLFLIRKVANGIGLWISNRRLDQYHEARDYQDWLQRRQHGRDTEYDKMMRRDPDWEG